MTTPDLNLSREIVLNVDTFEDQNDGTADNGLSLRDAVIIANADRENEYIINLQAGTYNLSVDGLTIGDLVDSFDGALTTNNNITIRGVESAIGETIIDGSLLNNTEDIFFLSSFNEAILNLENLTIENSPQAGIRIFAPSAKVNISDSLIINNQNSGIVSQGTVYITDSMIIDNFSLDGAGGIQNIGTGVMTIVNSTIAGNVSQNGAGGIVNDFIAPTSEETFGGSGDLTILNSTISNNTSISGIGGGIFARFTPPEDEDDAADLIPTELKVINSTIVENNAPNGAGISSEQLSLFNNRTIIQNSIIANNTGSADIEGVFNLTSQNNLIGSSNGNLINGLNNNVVGSEDNPIDPEITPLQDNGGQTLTHGLQSNSPAINAGNNAFAQSRELFTLFPTTDQTGIDRIQDNIVDLGSFEFTEDSQRESGNINRNFDFSNTITLNVTNTEDQNDGESSNGLSLGDTIVIANNEPIDILDAQEVLSNSQTSDDEPVLDDYVLRFQNTTLPGTYLFALEDEANIIRRDFPIFEDEGLAFDVSEEAHDDLIAIYRLQNSDLPGTYLYTTTEEKNNILNSRDNFSNEGIAFYVYSADADKGEDIYRFQSLSTPGTYLFVKETEKDNILANYASEFTLEGVAFEVGL